MLRGCSSIDRAGRHASLQPRFGCFAFLARGFAANFLGRFAVDFLRGAFGLGSFAGGTSVSATISIISGPDSASGKSTVRNGKSSKTTRCGFGFTARNASRAITKNEERSRNDSYGNQQRVGAGCRWHGLHPSLRFRHMVASRSSVKRRSDALRADRLLCTSDVDPLLWHQERLSSREMEPCSRDTKSVNRDHLTRGFGEIFVSEISDHLESTWSSRGSRRLDPSGAAVGKDSVVALSALYRCPASQRASSNKRGAVAPHSGFPIYWFRPPKPMQTFIESRVTTNSRCSPSVCN